MPRLLAVLAVVAVAGPAAGAGEPAYTRTEDVIYGRKYGLALTLDVIAPKETPNGLGVVFCVSGGWYSDPTAIIPRQYAPFLARGYTVFAVVHGSQPKFTVPEALDDIHRAVRWVRANAGRYAVDPGRLGIAGASAGGHLALMVGVAPRPADPKARDPVGRQPSRVAAVACFYPPTDFLNYGKENGVALGTGTLAAFRPPFEFWERDPKTNALSLVTDDEKRKAVGRAISPAYHVTPDAAPALVVHGDADRLVPIQQAERIAAGYKKAGAPFELVVKKGAGHGWLGMDKDTPALADWFDKHLRPAGK